VLWQFGESESPFGPRAQILPVKSLEVASNDQPGCCGRREVIEVIEKLRHRVIEVLTPALVLDGHLARHE